MSDRNKTLDLPALLPGATEECRQCGGYMSADTITCEAGNTGGIPTVTLRQTCEHCGGSYERIYRKAIGGWQRVSACVVADESGETDTAAATAA